MVKKIGLIAVVAAMAASAAYGAVERVTKVTPIWTGGNMLCAKGVVNDSVTVFCTRLDAKGYAIGLNSHQVYVTLNGRKVFARLYYP